MRVHSYTIIHYGKDYLSYALQSVFPSVEQMHVIYTPHPSHGHQTNVPPVETKEEIQQSIAADLFEKIKWYEMRNVYQEGIQRDMALDICREAGAEIVLVVDTDEVWPQDTLEKILFFVKEGAYAPAQKYMVNMVHLWRSFNWCCADDGWPVRVFDFRQDGISRQEFNSVPRGLGMIYHFGYAITDKVMRYKWQIHGHKNEMREGWLDNIWDKWYETTDWAEASETGEVDRSVHPTNAENFWIPEPFDKEVLPDLMRGHPFWDLEKIE